MKKCPLTDLTDHTLCKTRQSSLNNCRDDLEWMSKGASTSSWLLLLSLLLETSIIMVI